MEAPWDGLLVRSARPTTKLIEDVEKGKVLATAPDLDRSRQQQVERVPVMSRLSHPAGFAG
jgi:hypothetical protein